MGNTAYDQVISRSQQEVISWVEAQLVDAFHECGLNCSEEDPEKFKAEMRDKGIQVDKIINGPESGFYVKRGEILVRFIPTNVVEGALI